MRSLRLLWVVAPLFVGACSVINAPEEITPGTSSTTGGGGSGATGGSGGATTTTTTGGGGMTTTTEDSVCGDGKLTGSEGCDDDNTVAGDGCSAKCLVEDGFDCTDAMQELSVCTKLCGNGTLDPGEECDDKNQGDPNPATGDQDACNASCRFKEFDVEVGAVATAHNEFPITGFRQDAGDPVPYFYVAWHSSTLNKIQSRKYKFDGTYKQGTGAVDFAPTANPESSGERLCTAPSNRSLLFWRDQTDAKLYSRKIESTGVLSDPVVTDIVNPEVRLACATSGASAFIVATTAKPDVSAPLWDVTVRPFNSFAAPSGAVVNVGAAAAPVAVNAWGLANGFMVSWVADSINNGPIGAQLLGNNGAVMAGFVFTLSEGTDVAPREPWGERIGMQDQFAFAYTRDSVPDGAGATHREIALRIFSSAGDGSASAIMSPDANPQSQPRIAVNPTNGKFVVVWTGGAVNGENVFFRAFDKMGGAITPATDAAESLVGQQTQGSAAVDPVSGDVAIVWDSFVPNSGKPHKIVAKIFAGLLKD